MARLRVRVELNRGGVGVPLNKLASVVHEAQRFFEMLAEDVHIAKEGGEWLGFDFDNESLNFTAEFVGPVSQEQIEAFYDAFDGTTSLRRGTIAQFTQITQAIGEDELIGFGLYQSDQESEPVEWRCLSRRDALRIAEEMHLLSGAAGEEPQETHLPSVIDSGAGAKLFKDRTTRGGMLPERLPDLVREIESTLSHRINKIETHMELNTQAIRDLRESSAATEESFKGLLNAVENFCGQATKQLERLTPVPAEIPKAIAAPASEPVDMTALAQAVSMAQAEAVVPPEPVVQVAAAEPVAAAVSAAPLAATAAAGSVPAVASALASTPPAAATPATASSAATASSSVPAVASALASTPAAAAPPATASNAAIASSSVPAVAAALASTPAAASTPATASSAATASGPVPAVASAPATASSSGEKPTSPGKIPSPGTAAPTDKPVAVPKAAAAVVSMPSAAASASKTPPATATTSDSKPVLTPITAAKPRRSFRALLVAAAAIVVLVAAGLVWWPRASDPAGAVGSAPSSVIASTAPAPPVQPKLDTVPAQNPNTEKAASIAPSAPSPVKPAPREPENTQPVASSATPSNEASAEPMQIEIQAEEPAWVMVTDKDGKILIARTLQPNETRSLDIGNNAMLRTGNAGGVHVRLNGKDLGRLGPTGKIRDIQFKSGEFKITIPDAS